MTWKVEMTESCLVYLWVPRKVAWRVAKWEIRRVELWGWRKADEKDKTKADWMAAMKAAKEPMLVEK